MCHVVNTGDTPAQPRGKQKNPTDYKHGFSSGVGSEKNGTKPVTPSLNWHRHEGKGPVENHRKSR